jgi:hypothetical protein
VRSLFKTYYCKLRNRPRGAVTVGLFLGALAVVCALAAGCVFEAFRPYGLAVAAGYFVLTVPLVWSLLINLEVHLNDVGYAVSLENGLRRAGYEPQDLFTEEAAGNPSLQLLNLKILRFCRPQRTLELGSGQTTKLLSCYQRQNPGTYVLTLEQDERWVQRLRAQVVHDYRYARLERKAFTCAGTGLHLATEWYRDLPELHDQRFDYVLVDGPDHHVVGTAHVDHSRCGILQYMPALLALSFVVVFDDAERCGEKMTIDALDAILRAGGIEFERFARYGVKTQIVFCSKDHAFLRSS